MPRRDAILVAQAGEIAGRLQLLERPLVEVKADQQIKERVESDLVAHLCAAKHDEGVYRPHALTCRVRSLDPDIATVERKGIAAFDAVPLEALNRRIRAETTLAAFTLQRMAAESRSASTRIDGL